MVNKSTKFTPFQLRFGRSPRVLPALITTEQNPSTLTETDNLALTVYVCLHTDIQEAQDNLTHAKITQAAQANKTRNLSFPFHIRDWVRLSTKNRRHEFKNNDHQVVAKFMARFDGPFTITGINEEHSTVTLNLPNSANYYPVIHTSNLIPAVENDDTLFPSRASHKPAPILVNSQVEHYVEQIIKSRQCGRGCQYLVRWHGEGPEGDVWLARREIKNCKTLEHWLAAHLEVEI